MSFTNENGDSVETTQQPYRAFLLRCWQEPGAGPGGKSAWRYTLVQLGDGERKQGFTNLDGLFDYLREELAQPS